MLFGTMQFALFFVIAMAITWLLPSNKTRKVFLVAASYAFYAYWDYRFLSLVVFVTLCAWGSSVLVARISDERRRRLVVFISVALQLAVLGFFKYFNFFTANAIELVRTLGGHVDQPTLAIILPIGLSFYVFHSISYTVDCYKGKVDSKEHGLVDVALYIAFFPQLIAGPIIRGVDFLPQLREKPLWSTDRVVAAARLFVIGFCYKYLIADNLALIADPVFASPAQWSAVALWGGVTSYFAQIYFDFAGYSSMAIACAGFLGYSLPDNFRFPYTSRSTTEFWRRWHISLSTWLRDYLFIPLGGSRRGRPRYYANLFITMGLGGLWHGASWNFCAWGLLHGVGLTVHKAITGERPPQTTRRVAGIVQMAVAVAITQVWVMLLWVFFRSQSFADSANILSGMFTLRSGADSPLQGAAIFMPLALVALDGVIGRVQEMPSATPRGTPAFAYGAVMGLAVVATLFGWAIGDNPFIYFRF